MKKFLKSVWRFFKGRPYSIILLLWPFQWLWYGLLNSSQTAETSHIIYMALDDKIPFCEYFSVPYMLWYPYIAVATLFTLWKNRKDFMRMTTMIYLGMFGSMLFCTIYKSWHNLRPETIPDNIFTLFIKFTYAVDNPAVIFPSMHVLVAVLITVALFRSECMKGKTGWKTAAVIYTVLVSASTVFIKQHSIADVFFALAFVIPYTLLTYCVIWPEKRFIKFDKLVAKFEAKIKKGKVTKAE